MNGALGLGEWSLAACSGSSRKRKDTRTTERSVCQRGGGARNGSGHRRLPCASLVSRAQGTEGGLFWGNTIVEPGKVDSEYFMTHGHFHLKRNRTEYYATIEGEGALILMDDTRRTWFEPMSAGTVHFIPPNVAHRVANVGSQPLR